MQVVDEKKKAYQAPQLTTLGDIAQITLGNDLGEELDAMYTISSLQRGRRKKDLLFS